MTKITQKSVEFISNSKPVLVYIAAVMWFVGLIAVASYALRFMPFD